MPLWGHQRSVNENFFLVDLKLQVEMGLRQIKENQVTEDDATGCASDSDVRQTGTEMFWNCSNAEVRA